MSNLSQWEPWKPTLKQERFLSVPFSVKEGFYAGSAGAGKSDVLLMFPIVHQWVMDPNFKALFLRRTMPELREEIIPRSKTKLQFERYGFKPFSKNDAVWEHESGSLYFFGHCEWEDDVHKYDSAQWNYIAFDELTSFTEWQYLYLTFERTRRDKAHPHLPAITRSASNPGNTGHAWVRKRFVEPARSGFKIINGKGGNKRIFIPATLADNPHIDPDYSKSLDALPEAERQAKKFGNWDAYSGQVFDEFRDKHYPDEPANALHVIEPFLIPEFWPKLWVIDWGFAANTWVGYGAVSPEHKLYIYRERSWNKTKIEEWAPYIKEDALAENPNIIKMCRSAGQERGQEHTIQQQVTNAIGRNVSLTNNSFGTRVAGKMLVHEYLRWRTHYVPKIAREKYSDERADWIYRNKTLEEYKKYQSQFYDPDPEINIPKLQIFNTCTLLIDAIKACSYDKTNPEDVAEFPGDDPYDGLRYLVDAADNFFATSEQAFKSMEARESLIQEFEQTGDWNILFRKARVLETQSRGPGPMPRYRHGR